MASAQNFGSASSVSSIWSWRRPTGSIRWNFLGPRYFEKSNWPFTGGVHRKKPARERDLQEGEPQHLWGGWKGPQSRVTHINSHNKRTHFRWMARTTSCTAKTSAYWPSYSSTTRLSTLMWSLSSSTYSARWTGRHRRRSLRITEKLYRSSGTGITLWATFQRRKRVLMETMLLASSHCLPTRSWNFLSTFLKCFFVDKAHHRWHLARANLYPYLEPFPHLDTFQRKGYGKLLIAFSYELSKMEQVKNHL